MKRILIIFLGLSLITSMAYGIDLESPGEGEIRSQGMTQWKPQKTFRMVRVIPGLNYSAAANTDRVVYEVSKGMVMIWWTGTSGSDGVTVAPAARVSYDSRVAGVMATNAIMTIVSQEDRNFQYVTDDVRYENWGYLQTYGYAYVFIGAAVTAGDMLGTCFAVTGGAAPFLPNSAASTVLPAASHDNDPARIGTFGFAMDSDAGFSSGDQIRAFIQCE